jgi:hypothetical protein
MNGKCTVAWYDRLMRGGEQRCSSIRVFEVPVGLWNVSR